MRYWKRVDEKGKTTTVESYSHGLDIEGAIEIDQAEYQAFIDSLPVIEPEPQRDLEKELDDLKARVDAIESQVPFTTG